MTNEQLIQELKKHPPKAEVNVELRLSENYRLTADSIAYRIDTDEVVISGGK
jgi:hypothetical protein